MDALKLDPNQSAKHLSAEDPPKITVIVPCYNHVRYLEHCINSLQAQTYPNFNIIIVDDGSHKLLQPDINKFDDERIQLIRHETNRGPAAARNTGIRACSSDYFICVDADDKIDPTTLTKLSAVLRNDDSLDCALSDVLLFGAEDRVVPYEVPTFEDILRSQAIPGSGTMMRRSLWKRIGGYDEAEILRRGREDWEYYIRAFQRGCRAGHVSEPLYHYRISNKSLNVTCRLHDAEVAEYIYEKHRELFESAGEGDRFLSFGYYKSATSWFNHGYRAKALRLAVKAWRLDPTSVRLRLVVVASLPRVVTTRLHNESLGRYLPFVRHPLCNKGAARYRPFFVIGSGRSGSTLFRRVLTSHPNLHIPPENHQLGTCIRKFLQFRRKMNWPDLVHLTMSLFEFHHEFYTFEVSLRPLVQELCDLPKEKRNLAHMLDAFYRFHAERHGCSMVRWGDKTPLNSYEPGTLDLILKIFPDAQFIHLVRDGCDVVASTLRYGFFTSVATAANRWVQVVENARRFTEAHPERSMVVRYEDLVSRTESTTKSICHFLDVAFDPLMLRSEEISESLGDVPLLHEHKEVSAPINTENIGSGRVDLSYTDREQLESVIGKELKIFGYPSCISSNAV